MGYTGAHLHFTGMFFTVSCGKIDLYFSVCCVSCIIYINTSDIYFQTNNAPLILF